MSLSILLDLLESMNGIGCGMQKDLEWIGERVLGF